MTQAIQTRPLGHYRLHNVARSETWKILTLRSTAIMLGLTVAFSLLVTGLVVHDAVGHDVFYYQHFDPTNRVLAGMIVAALTSGVFGALLITGEYSSGTIRTTLAATPRRPVLLAAKLGVTAALTLAFSVLLSLATFLLGQAILSSGGAPSDGLGSPGALRAVVLTGVVIALMALMSVGFGLICRSTAGAIASFVAVIFVLPLVMQGISEPDMRYLPTTILSESAMRAMAGPPGSRIQAMAPGTGVLLMVVYSLVVVAAGVVLFLRRDA